ncbi:MAG: GNAT family N-acetyltransferase [Chloroflexi bacterium]|nr:GNAT family N-acetyltransferase [Chloroflexota bacterium]
MSSAIQIRKYRQKTQDLAEMVRIKNERSIAMDEPPSSTEERLLRSFEQYIFGMEIERDVFLAWRETQCLGFGFCMMNGAYNTGYIDTNIAPAAVLSEVFPPLFAATEQHIRQTLGGDQLPREKPFFIDTFAQAHPVDEQKISLLKELGYFEVRRFYDMLIRFEPHMKPATFPDGLEYRPFQRQHEARAYHMAYLESFRDHWGNISIDDFDQFAKHFDNPDFNESLWFGAWEGEEIAGVLFGEISPGHPQRGSVDLLGVRRPWRRRGLGTALLRQAFHLFQKHGFTEAELNVDAESRTNAVALYQRAGMHTIKEELVLRKMIWGRPEDIVE